MKCNLGTSKEQIPYKETETNYEVWIEIRLLVITQILPLELFWRCYDVNILLKKVEDYGVQSKKK